MASSQTIAGRYRVERRLGVGGMSTVHLAFDQRLERYVALKLLAEHLADDPTFVSRFRREALAAARLIHPNIVQVFDFGFDEGQHQHFIVMEHVPGQSCAELLRDHGRLEVDEAIEIISQACRGLDYAHRNGVIHRDVKPGNLLVSEAEVVKLADFGIARAAGQSSITQVGSVLGTAAYLAPEQARGEEAGPQADIYSLGVVTYQLLSGRLPYEANSLSELTLKQQREAPAPLDQVNPAVPRELARAVSFALALEPERRPADAIAFGEALRKGAHGIEPPLATASTAALGTGATRVISGRDDTAATRMATQARPAPATAATGARPVRRLEPRPYATDPYQRLPPTYVEEPRRRGRAARRVLLGLFIGLLFAAAVVIALVVSTSTSPTVTNIRTTVSHDAHSAINSLSNLINQYTK
ncbi:MAG TPA: protein kinase [Solirubrobacteraceae bacterium]|nr:protein kinase [Solirubrobacteraceae bacterium]